MPVAHKTGKDRDSTCACHYKSRGFIGSFFSAKRKAASWNWNRDRCYDFLNIFAENFSEKIGVFDSKQS
jgi:hypothetical protein